MADITSNLNLAERLRGMARGYSTESGRDALLAAARIVEPSRVETPAEPVTVINLDDEMWREVKAAIVESPRFAEMYAAGGMLNDGISNTVAWLREPAPERPRPKPSHGCRDPACDYCNHLWPDRWPRQVKTPREVPL